MEENKRKTELEDYKERFEFRLTFGENDTIICQRYFKIRDFNPRAYGSLDLAEAIRYCARLIDDDLKYKTAIYLDYMAPQVFDTEAEMFEYYKDEEHCAHIGAGHGIVIRDEKAPNYAWDDKKKCPIALSEKFDFGDYSSDMDDCKVELKLSFYDDGRLVCATCWDGYYPLAIRKGVDLSNDTKKILGDRKEIELSLREHLLYKMAEGRGDIVYQIIKEIREACSMSNDSYERYGVYVDTFSGEKRSYDYGYCFEQYKLCAEAQKSAEEEKKQVRRNARFRS